MQLTVELPDKLAQNIVPDGVDPARTALEYMAAEAYRNRRLTDSQLSSLLGMTRLDLDEFLKRREIWLDDSMEDLQRDLETHRCLGLSMSFATADASPIHSLALLGIEALLEPGYKRVLIPAIVAGELQAGKVPEIVRRWVRMPPAWAEMVPVPATEENFAFHGSIDAAELAAIRLSLQLRPELELMDDRAGVAAAIGLGLRVTGTLGVLSSFAESGSIDLDSALGALQRTNIRVHPKLIREILDAHLGP